MTFLPFVSLGVLFYCIYPTKRHTRCLQLALKYQADPNNMSTEGTHIFQLMCEKAQECTPLCLIMLDAGTDPNATNQVKIRCKLRKYENSSVMMQLRGLSLLFVEP